MRLSHVQAHIEQQLLTSTIITKAYENLVGDGLSNVTTRQLTSRLASLKEDWERFCLEHKAIFIAMHELSDDDRNFLQNHQYFATNVYSTTHDIYVEVTDRLNALLENDHGSVPSTSSTQNATCSSAAWIPAFFHHARLPMIDMPKFNGNPSDWLDFKDLFSSVVIAHPTLSSVEKLHYLKTSLTGSAASLLQNTVLSADNFQKSWEALNAFYENKRVLVDEAFHALLAIKRITKESAKELEELYTQVTQIYRTFESLQRPVSYWDDFLIFIVLQRLDAHTAKAWEQKLGSSTEPPTWRQFTAFLISRLLSAKAFEASRTGRSVQLSQKSAKAHFQGKSNDSKSNNASTCPICSANHYLAHCAQYKSKSVPQRLAIVQKHKLCYNCLGAHKITACRVTKRCIKCGKRHHTSIHKEQDKPSVKSDNTKSLTDTSQSPLPSIEAKTLQSS